MEIKIKEEVETKKKTKRESAFLPLWDKFFFLMQTKQKGVLILSQVFIFSSSPSVFSDFYTGGSLFGSLSGECSDSVDLFSGSVWFSTFIGTFVWWLSQSDWFSFRSGLIQCLRRWNQPTWQTLCTEEIISKLLLFLSSFNN